MELSHAISDSVLTLAGIFVYFNFLKKLNPTMRLVWSPFILSITIAAFFGAIRFWGYPPARAVSDVFQHVAGTIGAFCLVLAAYLLITRKVITRNDALGFIIVGFVLFLWVQISGNLKIVQFASIIAIPLVLLIGIWGLIKGKTAESSWLIMGVLALIIATFNKSIAANLALDFVDLYHYLVTISVLCFGKAASYTITPTQ